MDAVASVLLFTNPGTNPGDSGARVTNYKDALTRIKTSPSDLSEPSLLDLIAHNLRYNDRRLLQLLFYFIESSPDLFPYFSSGVLCQITVHNGDSYTFEQCF